MDKGMDENKYRHVSNTAQKYDSVMSETFLDAVLKKKSYLGNKIFDQEKQRYRRDLQFGPILRE